MNYIVKLINCNIIVIYIKVENVKGTEKEKEQNKIQEDKDPIIIIGQIIIIIIIMERKGKNRKQGQRAKICIL